MQEKSSLLPVVAGTIGLTVVLSQFTQYIPPVYIFGSIGLTAFTGLAYAAEKIGKSRLDKYFKAANFKNAEGTYAKVKHKITTENGVDYHVKVPLGLCKSDFEKDKESMEHAMNARIKFEVEKGELVLKTTKRVLKTEYKFEPIPCDNPLEVCIGYSLDGAYKLDIEKMTHILIAGETNGGKSVLLRTILTALITGKRPEDIEINLVDFQRVELGIFKRCAMVNDFCTTPDEFNTLLDHMKAESNKRLDLFEKNGVVNIEGYNRRHIKNKLKYITVFVDEFATLAQKEYKPILQALKVRMAQDRKCGIHYVICTQRPSVDIIDGTIKANMPGRIALKTATDTDSQIILDENGAEHLRGAGHAIVKFAGTTEIQVFYLSETTARKLVEPTFINKQSPKAEPEEMGVISLADRQRQANNRTIRKF